MASTNKTSNLELPQWQSTEKPEMVDFNTAFEKVDTIVGDLTTLTTDEKTKLVGAISEVKDEFIAHKAESANKHIKESGSNDDGYYIIFDDGTMRCRKIVEGTTDITTAWGSGFTTGAQNTIQLGAYPKPFAEKPALSITLERYSDNAWLASLQGSTATDIGRISLLRFNERENVEFQIHVTAEGECLNN